MAIYLLSAIFTKNIFEIILMRKITSKQEKIINWRIRIDFSNKS